MKKVFSNIPDDIFLSEVNIAGTHDSCTAFCSMENMARCQSLTVQQQLDIGVRLFDIRLANKHGKFFLVHDMADCYADKERKSLLLFDTVLECFKKFLEENPNEALVVSIKQDRGIRLKSFFKSFYEKYIRGDEKHWFLKNENPRLSDCRGKLVLMRRCKVTAEFEKENDVGLDFSFWPDQKGKRKTEHKSFAVAYSDSTDKEPSLKAFVQDRYSLEPKVKWNECIEPFFEKCSPDAANICVNFFSTAFRYNGKTLKETADEVNGYFMNRHFKNGELNGWILFDFPTERLVDKVVNSNCVTDKEKKE